jgi:hypothetical protein
LTVAIAAVLFGTTLGALWGLASGSRQPSPHRVSAGLSGPDLAMAIAMALDPGSAR